MQKSSVFSRKKENFSMNTALMQLGHSTKIVLDAKKKNIGFSIISYLVVCFDSVALNFNFKRRQIF